MNIKKDLPERKNIRLKNYDYSSPGEYFITICTDNQKNIFWNDNLDPEKFTWATIGEDRIRPINLPLSVIGNIVSEELERWDKTYAAVSLCSYVIMPNHLHIIMRISAGGNGQSQTAPTLVRMIKQFKGAVTKKVGYSIWQKSFMEHVIRNKEDFETRSNYVCENPLRWHYNELPLEERQH